MLEVQTAFIADGMATMNAQGADEVQVTQDAMADYTAELLDGLEATVWAAGCDSCFRAAGGEVITQIPHTTTWYRERLERFRPDDFNLGRAT